VPGHGGTGRGERPRIEAGGALVEAEVTLRQAQIVGGAYATFAPELVIRRPSVDMVCVGEGELALVELCEKLRRGADVTAVRNIWIKRDGKLLRPKRLPSNLFQFRAGTGEARCVLDCITSLQNGADLLWIETEKPHIAQIGGMVSEIRKVIPNAKLVYNNSPSFNWTLNFRQQVYDAMKAAGKDVSAYERGALMSTEYDQTELAKLADEKIRTFQADASREAGIFHHLITLPTYHTAALSTDNLARASFGDQGMLGYVAGVQRKEIRQGIACVKHQNMSGSDIGDDHKEYFSGEAALKAAGKDNTMNQFH
jgi:isocitrate lyase